MTNKEKMEVAQNGRGKVITNFAFLEILVSKFITIHYFKAENNVFTEEVMENAYFSFDLKRRILGTILKKYYPEVLQNFPNKEFDEIQKIRNILAHGALQGKAEEGKPLNIVYTFFKHGGIAYQTDELLEKYHKLASILQDALQKLPGINTRIVNDGDRV